MSDLALALGIVLAVEGLVFAAFPDAAKRAMIETARTSSDRLRVVGLVSAIVGVAFVWLARG
jgi:uncharacterized protein YjeT (DUF2065 family)